MTGGIQPARDVQRLSCVTLLATRGYCCIDSFKRILLLFCLLLFFIGPCVLHKHLTNSVRTYYFRLILALRTVVAYVFFIKSFIFFYGEIRESYLNEMKCPCAYCIYSPGFTSNIVSLADINSDCHWT